MTSVTSGPLTDETLTMRPYFFLSISGNRRAE